MSVANGSRNVRVLLYVGATSYVGGPLLSACQIAKHLHARGAQVTIASLCRLAGNDNVTSVVQGVPLLDTPFGRPDRFRWVRNLYALVSWSFRLGWQSQDTVVCMGHGGFHLFLKLFVARGGQLIYRETGAGGGRLPAWPMRLFLRSVNGVLVLCDSAKSRLAAQWGVRASMRVVPEIVPDMSMGKPRGSYLGEGDVLRVGYLGRLDRDKGVKDLVLLWPKLAIEPAVLRIYGDGRPEFEAELRDTIRDLGLGDQVTLSGRYARTELSTILGTLDLVVLLSRSEGLPTVLVEALSAGVPFVATAVGCVPDLLRDNPDSVAVSCCEQSCIEAIEKMANDIRDQRISAERLQSVYREHYSVDHVADLWYQAVFHANRFWQECRD